jgi:hypothetical protein
MPFNLTVVFRADAKAFYFKPAISVFETASAALQQRATLLRDTTPTARVFDVAVISDDCVRIDAPWDEGFRASIYEHLADIGRTALEGDDDEAPVEEEPPPPPPPSKKKKDKKRSK